jgi:predicted transglutaminase-like cysteine proteinase
MRPQAGGIAMHHASRLVILIPTFVVIAWSSVSEAAFFGFPRGLKYQFSQILFDTPALPPFGHTRFCLRYPDECKVRGIDFRRRNIRLTLSRWEELKAVNRQINSSIIAQVTAVGGTFDEWLISPVAGDCKAYALTKRHELLARGWPSRALLLAEVIVPDGQHHLVLIVRTKETDLVLDNLSPNVRPVSVTYRHYQWVRVETPQNPKFWVRVRTPRGVQTAALSRHVF